ncbi:hypothetical protein ECPA14_6030 [Escherichia coli PA14]|nr:hypothetical protein ECPA14_6030 [Escherichia coli PA14]
MTTQLAYPASVHNYYQVARIMIFHCWQRPEVTVYGEAAFQ